MTYRLGIPMFCQIFCWDSYDPHSLITAIVRWSDEAGFGIYLIQSPAWMRAPDDGTLIDNPSHSMFMVTFIARIQTPRITAHEFVRCYEMYRYK